MAKPRFEPMFSLFLPFFYDNHYIKYNKDIGLNIYLLFFA